MLRSLIFEPIVVTSVGRETICTKMFSFQNKVPLNSGHYVFHKLLIPILKSITHSCFPTVLLWISVLAPSLILMIFTGFSCSVTFGKCLKHAFVLWSCNEGFYWVKFITQLIWLKYPQFFVSNLRELEQQLLSMAYNFMHESLKLTNSMGVKSCL